MNKEIKKITVEEFIEKNNSIKVDALKPKIELVTDYLSFESKLALVNHVVDTTMYEFDIENKRTNNVKINSIFMYLYFTMSIIDNYTNLSIDFNKVNKEYDLLKKNGFIEKIINVDPNGSSIVPVEEYIELKTFLDMSVNDIIQNNLNIQSFISYQVERFGYLSGITLEPVIEKLTTAIENLDDKKIEKIGSKLDRFLDKVTK